MHIRSLLTAFALSLLAACGGGSGASDAGGPITVDLHGVWRGSTSGGASIVCMIGKPGPLLCYDMLDEQYIVDSFKGDVSPFRAGGSITPAANSQYEGFDLSLKGSGDATGISGQIQLYPFEPGPNTIPPFDFKLRPYRPLSGAASIQAGHWTGFYPGQTTPGEGGSTGIEVDVTAAGKLTGTDGYGCTLKGSLTAIDHGDPDLFSVTLARSGNLFCDFLSSTTGLAYESETDDLHLFGGHPGPYYYMIVWQFDDVIRVGSLLVFKAE